MKCVLQAAGDLRDVAPELRPRRAQREPGQRPGKGFLQAAEFLLQLLQPVQFVFETDAVRDCRLGSAGGRGGVRKGSVRHGMQTAGLRRKAEDDGLPGIAGAAAGRKGFVGQVTENSAVFFTGFPPPLSNTGAGRKGGTEEVRS